MMKDTLDLFSHNRLDDGGEEFIETRTNRKPYMEDNKWRPELVRYVYSFGARGVKLSTLARAGIGQEWWQDTVSKHFGEKMRVSFSTGLIFVPVYPTVTTLDHIRVVHPAFVTLIFENSVLQADSDRVREHMCSLDYVDQGKKL